MMANDVTKEAMATHLSLTEPGIGAHQQAIISKFGLQAETDLMRSTTKPGIRKFGF